MSGVHVSVRVRPFLPKIDGDDICCVDMTDVQTVLTDKKGDGDVKRYLGYSVREYIVNKDDMKVPKNDQYETYELI